MAKYFCPNKYGLHIEEQIDTIHTTKDYRPKVMDVRWVETKLRCVINLYHGIGRPMMMQLCHGNTCLKRGLT